VSLESINISCDDASLRIKYAVSGQALVSLSKKASYKEVAIIHNFVAFVVVLVNIRQNSVIFAPQISNLINFYLTQLVGSRSDERIRFQRYRQIPGDTTGT